MDYPKSVPNVGLVNGKFVDENAATGQVGSLIPSAWGNGVTDELLNVIRAGGKVPAEAEHDQLLAAIKAIVRDSIPPEKIRTTLAEYGITDAYTKSVTYTKAEIEALLKNMSALPVGAMVPFPKGTVPPGFLEVDGSVQSIATYPDLSAYLGTVFNKGDEGAGNFRLPESRGEFFRGWDHGRGVDAGRGVGSWQADELRSHTHPIGNQNTYGSGSSAGPLHTGGKSGDLAQPTGPVGGAETRPRNLAVMWCLKAWNAPVNQGTIDIAALAAQVAGFSARATALEERPRGVGDGQAWQHLTASRVSGTVYTNTTGRPIFVQVSFTTGGVYVVVDGVNLTVSAYHAAFIVPAGSTYKVTYGSPSNLTWVELRT
ncbi:phage tail protein [Pseudomonas protegens]|nr:phage tail protein [Pseudomonas protegens]MCU1765335.1 phage tail protein [Pseudomonas protegens]